MAATTRADPYAIFMRKVGYTVGLERTLERVTDLERAYVTNRDLTWADWRALVHEAEHWNLQSDHIGAVFRVMGFVQRTAGELFVLDNLDAMAIACELAATESERERIRRFIFLWALLLSDGELFVNMLLAEFDEARIGEFMRKVLTHKRRVLRERLPDPGSARRVARVVRIARQVGNPGSKGKQDLRSGGTRTEPLEAEFRRKLARAGSVEIPVLAFSEDYFRKVPPRRKDWARSLELWSDAVGLTELGRRFRDGLADRGYLVDGRYFVFWPMRHELIREGFAPNLLGPAGRELWPTLLDFAGAYSELDLSPQEPPDREHAVELLRTMMRTFRSLHTAKVLLRQELGLTVAYPATVALAYGRGQRLVDLPRIIRAEQREPRRRIILRASRSTGSALSVRDGR